MTKLTKEVTVYKCDECGAEFQEELTKCALCDAHLCDKCRSERTGWFWLSDQTMVNDIPVFDNVSLRTVWEPCSKCWKKTQKSIAKHKHKIANILHDILNDIQGKKGKKESK